MLPRRRWVMQSCRGDAGAGKQRVVCGVGPRTALIPALPGEGTCCWFLLHVG